MKINGNECGFVTIETTNFKVELSEKEIDQVINACPSQELVTALENQKEELIRYSDVAEDMDEVFMDTLRLLQDAKDTYTLLIEAIETGKARYGKK